VVSEFLLFFWLNNVVGVECLPIFQQSVNSELYEWLLKEQKRRGARSIQDVIRQVLREAKAEAEKHNG
jgi:hypothetical protein